MQSVKGSSLSIINPVFKICTLKRTEVQEALNEKNSIFCIAIDYFIKCIRK